MAVLGAIVRKLLARKGFALIRQKELDSLIEVARPRGAFGWHDVFDLVRSEKKPTVLLDIGANRGAFCELAGNYFENKGGCLIHAFEPLPQELFEAGHERKDNVHFHQVALGDREGTVSFHVHSRHLTSSSVHETLPSFREYWPGFDQETREITVRQTGLDRILENLPEEQRLDAVDLMKIDTQGHERHVLAGATRTLSRTRYVNTEVSLIPTYVDGAMCDEICSILNDRGFRLVCAWGPHIRKGEVIQLDFLFEKRNAIS